MLDMLDVAIGLAFLYLIMSLVATAGVEILEAFLQHRARDLERGIREMLNNPGLVKAFYSHPLIVSLYKGTYGDNEKQRGRDEDKTQRGIWTLFWKWRLPSYIPAQSFALAMMDLVLPSGMANAMPSPADATAGKIDMTDLHDGGNTAVSAVAKLVVAANGDAAMARQNIETWFNSSMDRVSGWYKRRTQFFLLVAGFSAALAMNVDSIKVSRELVTNKAVRETAVATAIEWNKAHAQIAAQSQASAADVQKKIDAAKAAVSDAEKELKKAGLPIGWSRTWCEYWCDPKVEPIDILRKLLGLFITACAVSLGAPFWFDTLNKFIVVRSTVKPEEKSGTEAPKEPKK